MNCTCGEVWLAKGGFGVVYFTPGGARAMHCFDFCVTVRASPGTPHLFPRTFWVWESGVRHVTIGGGFSGFGIEQDMKVGRGRRGRSRVVVSPYGWLDWMGLAVGSYGYECTPLWRRGGKGRFANLTYGSPISWPEITAFECRGVVVSVAWSWFIPSLLVPPSVRGCVTRACATLAPAPAPAPYSEVIGFRLNK